MLVAHHFLTVLQTKSHHSFKSCEQSHRSSKPHLQSSQSSSIGSHTGTHVSIPNQTSSPMIESCTLPTLTPLLPNNGEDDDPVTTPIIGNTLVNISTTPIAHPTARSV